eukprot:4167739-Pyramimonas_sp.AAC.1
MTVSTPVSSSTTPSEDGSLGRSPSPPLTLRSAATSGREPILPALRFAVGDRVLANRGEDDGWKPGTIIDVYYHEEEWAPDKIAPYQIRLDEDHDCEHPIYAIHDTDGSVR